MKYNQKSYRSISVSNTLVCFWILINIIHFIILFLTIPHRSGIQHRSSYTLVSLRILVDVVSSEVNTLIGCWFLVDIVSSNILIRCRFLIFVYHCIIWFNFFIARNFIFSYHINFFVCYWHIFFFIHWLIFISLCILNWID